MKIENGVLDNTEKIIFSLRSLYRKYGYTPYKMSKFEEYDLYSRNKDFLISDRVITFTDTNGKLMALKPDVTLSIIKNNADAKDITHKLFYNENVYRVSKGTNSFMEIMQAGLECMGAVDEYCVSEVLKLAAESLSLFNRDFVLDISHLDLLSAFVGRISDSEKIQNDIIKCVKEKNTHGIYDICRINNIDKSAAFPLAELISVYGKPCDVTEKVKTLAESVNATEYADSLFEAVKIFSGTPYEDNIHIDFSVVSDKNYYNGIVFKGFVEGVPGSVLSGGQYDKLMFRMKRKSKAIGFAVYLDMLERIDSSNYEFDVDIMLLYDKKADIAKLGNAVSEQTAKGVTIFAGTSVNPKIKYRRLAEFKDGEVIFVENNA